MYSTCKICGAKFPDIPGLEKHLFEDHCLSWQAYSEILLQTKRPEDEFCHRCKTWRQPLTLTIPDPPISPCWSCLSDRKRVVQEAIGSVISGIREVYSDILGDRYLQLFLVDDIYFHNTLPHSYGTFKKVLSSLKLPGRNDIWFVDWLPGYPRVVSEDNLSGTRIVNLSELYRIESEPSRIEVNGKYQILLPDLVPYDQPHHSRYNIMNPSSERSTKRLKMHDSKDCIKFQPISPDGWVSIFKLTNPKTGTDVDPGKIPFRDYIVLKLCIMRNKNFMRRVYDIIHTIIPEVTEFRDRVFLRSRVKVNPGKRMSLDFSWLPHDLTPITPDGIKLSIL